MERYIIQNILEDNLVFYKSSEEYEEKKAYLNSLSDIDFFSYIGKLGISGTTYKEILESIFKINEQNKKHSIDRKHLPCFRGVKAGEIAREILKSSNPSCEINITKEQKSVFCDLWENGMNNAFIPSDIFFAKTVPLPDVVININEQNISHGTFKEDSARVAIKADYPEAIKNAGTEPVVIGALKIDIGEPIELVIPFTVIPGMNGISISGYYFVGENSLAANKAASLTQGAVGTLFNYWMATWYGIQIASLHPVVKDIFKNPSICINHSSKPNKRNSKKKVKYIKRHIINSDELNLLVYGASKEKSKNKRHALIWYVIGHWRHMKNGKKIFIQPYWKGALREIKQNINEYFRDVPTEGCLV